MSDAVSGEVSHYVTGTVAVIEAPASFDVYTAARVRALAIALQQDGVTRVVFDLTCVATMDSVGLGVIAVTHTRLRSSGGRVAVAAVQGPVTRLFQSTGMTKIVPVAATCQEAISLAQVGSAQ